MCSVLGNVGDIADRGGMHGGEHGGLDAGKDGRVESALVGERRRDARVEKNFLGGGDFQLHPHRVIRGDALDGRDHFLQLGDGRAVFVKDVLQSDDLPDRVIVRLKDAGRADGDDKGIEAVQGRGIVERDGQGVGGIDVYRVFLGAKHAAIEDVFADDDPGDFRAEVVIDRELGQHPIPRTTG